jgi:membrane protease YdiL (CAAX protease family)
MINNMKKTLNVALDVLWYLVVFALVQFVVTSAGGLLMIGIKGLPLSSISHILTTNAMLTIVTSILSSLITIALFVWRGWASKSRKYIQSRPWTTLVWVAIATFGLMLPAAGLEELMKLEMPKQLENLFSGIMKEPLGYVAIGMLAPLAEEIVFRGAILRRLLSVLGDKKHWVAILISALLFGAVHANSAQFVHAALLGLLLGWMYYRTDSIVPGVVLHWVNNTVAYLASNFMPGTEDATLSQLAGGQTMRIVLYLVFSLCIFFPALYQLNTRLKK